jgi:mitochondrial fission protein ELM1
VTEPVKPQIAWVLSDGRPGHYNQSAGIVRALQHLGPIEVEWLDVKLRIGFFRQVLKWLLNGDHFMLPDWLLKLCHRLPPLPIRKPDMIVSAGGKTSFLNAALAQKFSCKNIFAGSLRGLSDTLFSAVLTIEPIVGAERNIVLDIAPTVITLDEVIAAGMGFRQQRGLENVKLWAMIIGGDGAGYKYEEDDWTQLAAAMVELAAKYHIKWLVTTSRRTGVNVEAQLKKILPDGVIADSVWYSTDPQKIMLAYLGASELVFCTEDSMSMIAESIASGRAVITLSPRDKTPEKRYTEALQRYVDKLFICRLNIESTKNNSMEKTIQTLKPLSVATNKVLAGKLKPLFESQRAKR